jgi:hypothetical protein
MRLKNRMKTSKNHSKVFKILHNFLYLQNFRNESCSNGEEIWGGTKTAWKDFFTDASSWGDSFSSLGRSAGRTVDSLLSCSKRLWHGFRDTFGFRKRSIPTAQEAEDSDSDDEFQRFQRELESAEISSEDDFIRFVRDSPSNLTVQNSTSNSTSENKTKNSTSEDKKNSTSENKTKNSTSENNTNNSTSENKTKNSTEEEKGTMTKTKEKLIEFGQTLKEKVGDPTKKAFEDAGAQIKKFFSKREDVDVDQVDKDSDEKVDSVEEKNSNHFIDVGMDDDTDADDKIDYDDEEFEPGWDPSSPQYN